jgi:3-polyprenyl-4-hydroxybenzoate decarboxylase
VDVYAPRSHVTQNVPLRRDKETRRDKERQGDKETLVMLPAMKSYPTDSSAQVSLNTVSSRSPSSTQCHRGYVWVLRYLLPPKKIVFSIKKYKNEQSKGAEAFAAG